MIRPAVTASVLLLVLSRVLVAQEKETRLTLTDARGGYCISYLVDPAVAVGLAPEGATLAPAGKGAGLSPFLVRVIQDEPQFAAWIPAAICIGRYASAALDGREVARAKGDKAITVITSWVSVVDPMGVEGATAALLDLSVDESRVQRPLQDFGVRIDERALELVPGENGDTQIDLKLGKTRISWVGHPTGDPRVGSTQSMSFGYGGQRNSIWRVTSAVTPGETRLMVGALRVEGKDALAKALKSSPIRAVGPLESGGSAEFVFHRMAAR
jgi:hypothetical protein